MSHVLEKDDKSSYAPATKKNVDVNNMFESKKHGNHLFSDVLTKSEFIANPSEAAFY